MTNYTAEQLHAEYAGGWKLRKGHGELNTVSAVDIRKTFNRISAQNATLKRERDELNQKIGKLESQLAQAKQGGTMRSSWHGLSFVAGAVLLGLIILAIVNFSSIVDFFGNVFSAQLTVGWLILLLLLVWFGPRLVRRFNSPESRQAMQGRLKDYGKSKDQPKNSDEPVKEAKEPGRIASWLSRHFPSTFGIDRGGPS